MQLWPIIPDINPIPLVFSFSKLSQFFQVSHKPSYYIFS